jgi:hypothetical protein
VRREEARVPYMSTKRAMRPLCRSARSLPVAMLSERSKDEEGTAQHHEQSLPQSRPAITGISTIEEKPEARILNFSTYTYPV